MNNAPCNCLQHRGLSLCSAQHGIMYCIVRDHCLFWAGHVLGSWCDLSPSPFVFSPPSPVTLWLHSMVWRRSDLHSRKSCDKSDIKDCFCILWKRHCKARHYYADHWKRLLHILCPHLGGIFTRSKSTPIFSNDSYSPRPPLKASLWKWPPGVS